MSQGSAVGTARGRLAFVLGGSLLIASGVLSLAEAILPAAAIPFPFLGDTHFVLSVISAVLFAGALIIFAWGVRGEGSVVARRLPGAISLTILGLWNPVMLLLLRPVLEATPGESATAYLLFFGAPLLWFIVAIVTQVSIIRARALPGAWRWVPLIAALPYLVVVFAAQARLYSGSVVFADFPYEAFGWVLLAMPALLGLLAVGLAVVARRENGAPTDEVLTASA